MATKTRTDIHRPSAAEFDPETYTLAGVFDLHPKWGNKARASVVSACVDKGYKFASHQNGSQCGHCGAHIRYAALLLHAPSHEMIYVGETCLDSRFSGTKAEFDALRKSAKATRERISREERFQASLDDAVARDWVLEVLGNADACAALPYTVRNFACDVRGSLFRGPLSDPQVEKLAAAIDKARQFEEAKAAEQAASIPVPEGRQIVHGVVRKIALKSNDFSYYGETIVKMTVRDSRGFSIHCTAPAALLRLVDDASDLRGKEVEFEATLERSKDNETFGFAKRPTRAAVVAVAQ